MAVNGYKQNYNRNLNGFKFNVGPKKSGSQTQKELTLDAVLNYMQRSILNNSLGYNTAEQKAHSDNTPSSGVEFVKHFLGLQKHPNSKPKSIIDKYVIELSKNSSYFNVETFNEVFPRGFQKILAFAWIMDHPTTAFDREGKFNYDKFKDWLGQNDGDAKQHLTEKYYKHISYDAHTKTVTFGATEYRNQILLNLNNESSRFFGDNSQFVHIENSHKIKSSDLHSTQQSTILKPPELSAVEELLSISIEDKFIEAKSKEERNKIIETFNRTIEDFKVDSDLSQISHIFQNVEALKIICNPKTVKSSMGNILSRLTTLNSTKHVDNIKYAFMIDTIGVKRQLNSLSDENNEYLLRDLIKNQEAITTFLEQELNKVPPATSVDNLLNTANNSLDANTTNVLRYIFDPNERKKTGLRALRNQMQAIIDRLENYKKNLPGSASSVLNMSENLQISEVHKINITPELEQHDLNETELNAVEEMFANYFLTNDCMEKRNSLPGGVHKKMFDLTSTMGGLWGDKAAIKDWKKEERVREIVLKSNNKTLKNGVSTQYRLSDNDEEALLNRLKKKGFSGDDINEAMNGFGYYKKVPGAMTLFDVIKALNSNDAATRKAARNKFGSSFFIDIYQQKMHIFAELKLVGITHADSHAGNIILIPNKLFPSGYQVQIIDFGNSRFANDVTSTIADLSYSVSGIASQKESVILGLFENINRTLFRNEDSISNLKHYFNQRMLRELGFSDSQIDELSNKETECIEKIHTLLNGTSQRNKRNDSNFLKSYREIINDYLKNYSEMLRC